MPITTLTGLINTEIYEIGYFPLGTDVSADILLNQNKLNDTIDLVNDNESGLATAVADIANNLVGLNAARADIIINIADIATNAAGLVTNAADIATNAADILAVSADKLPTLVRGAGDHTLTNAEIKENDFITVSGAARITVPTEMYRTYGEDYVYVHTTTITSLTASTVEVYTGDADWADGTANTAKITIGIGESVVLVPVNLGTYGRWAIVGGKSYSDLA